MKSNIKSEIKILLKWLLSTLIIYYLLLLYLDIAVGKTFISSTKEYLNIFTGEDTFYLIYLFLLLPYLFYKFINLPFKKVLLLKSKVLRVILSIILILFSIPFLYKAYNNYLIYALINDPLKFYIIDSFNTPTKNNYRNYTYRRTWKYWCGNDDGIHYDTIYFVNDTTINYSSVYISSIGDNWFALKNKFGIISGNFGSRNYMYINGEIINYKTVDYVKKPYKNVKLKFKDGKLYIEHTDEIILNN